MHYGLRLFGKFESMGGGVAIRHETIGAALTQVIDNAKSAQNIRWYRVPK